jgi:hypothetical protein
MVRTPDADDFGGNPISRGFQVHLEFQKSNFSKRTVAVANAMRSVKDHQQPSNPKKASLR